MIIIVLDSNTNRLFHYSKKNSHFFINMNEMTNILADIKLCRRFLELIHSYLICVMYKKEKKIT